MSASSAAPLPSDSCNSCDLRVGYSATTGTDASVLIDDAIQYENKYM